MELARESRFIIPVLLFALVTACATAPPSEQGVVTSGPLKDGEGIVYGTVVTNFYNSNGEKLFPEDGWRGYVFYFGTSTNLVVKRMYPGLSENIYVSTKPPETFFVRRLAAGEYSMFRLSRGAGFVLTDIRFTVTPNKATYIGSLQIDFRGTRGLFGEERFGQKLAFKVIDDRDKVTKAFKERNPNLEHEVTTNLMKMVK